MLVFGESRVGGRFGGGVGEAGETVRLKRPSSPCPMRRRSKATPVTDQLVHDHFRTPVVEECHRLPNLPCQLQGFKRRWYR